MITWYSLITWILMIFACTLMSGGFNWLPSYIKRRLDNKKEIKIKRIEKEPERIEAKTRQIIVKAELKKDKSPNVKQKLSVKGKNNTVAPYASSDIDTKKESVSNQSEIKS